MTIHIVKSWTWFFEAIKIGLKLHDLRKNDRDYKVGDTLVLQEFDPKLGQYTGREIQRLITYVTSNQFPCALSSNALDREHIILSLRDPEDMIVKPDIVKDGDWLVTK